MSEERLAAAMAAAQHVYARFHAGDLDAVREPQVQALARDLVDLSQVETPEGPGLYLPGVQLATTLFWSRCVAAEQAGQPPDQADESALWTLVDTLRGIDPALVPIQMPEQQPDHHDIMATGRQALNQAVATFPFDQAQVRRAADLMLKAVTLAEGGPDHPTMLGAYGATMIDVYQCSGDVQDIEAAIAAIRAALGRLPGDHPMHVHLRAGLGGALTRRHAHNHDLADLTEAEAVLRGALRDYPPDADPTPTYADLGSALNARAEQSRVASDVEAAIVAVRDAVARIPANNPSYPGFNLTLGRLLHQVGPDLSTADEVVAAFRAGLPPDQVAERARTEPVALAHDLLALSATIMTRVDAADELTDATAADLDDCVALTRRATELMPDEPVVFSSLGVVMRVRWARVTEEIERERARFARGFRDEGRELPDPDADLQAALDMFDKAVALGGRPATVLELGITWKYRYDNSGDPADLDRAIEELDRALAGEVTPHGLLTYGDALASRFELTPARSDVDAAVETFQRAAAATEPGDREWLLAMTRYARMCSARFQHFGALADVELALTTYESVLSELAGDSPERGRVLWRLGVAYWQHHTALGEPADLNRSVDLLREALETLGFDDVERTNAVIALGNTLAARGQQLGSSSDVLEAARCFQAAVAREHDEASKHDAQSRLGKAMSQLAMVSGQRDHFEQAEAAFRTLLDADVNTHLRRQTAVYLGALLSVRAGLTANLTELDEGITLLRSGLGAEEPGASLNLANALKLRYRMTDDAADLDEAITALTGIAPGLATPPRTVLTLHLADLHVLRGAAGDDDRANRAYLEVAHSGAIHASYRVFAARQAARIASKGERWDEALTAYTMAVELLSLIAWGGLERVDQQRFIADFAGIAGEAAAAAMSAGQPETAVELLEHGRAVLWTRVLQTRGDPAYGSLDGLDPELAAELVGVRAGMATPNADLFAGGLPVEIATAHTRMVHAQREQELLAQVRAQPGYENFLRRRSFDELRAAAADGPVVLVNLTARRCDALVVTTAGVKPVELDVSLADVAERSETVLSPHRESDLAAFVESQSSLVDTLAWLWSTVVEPVLAEIPGASRVWWCPAGLATLFPLHAAGRYGDHHPVSAMDRVVSSYTTTLTALIRARQRAVAVSGNRLVVGVADAPDTPFLPNVDEEVRAIGADTILVGPAATADRVLAELARHPWVHIACHGYQDVANPSRSYLAMHDRPLTVSEIAELNLPAAELAFLSACETAASGALPDEAISAAAALQLAGYRHVIATLWPIPDRSTVTSSVYAKGAPPSDPARALHDAVRTAIAANPYEPTSWAPYQHLGP